MCMQIKLIINSCHTGPSFVLLLLLCCCCRAVAAAVAIQVLIIVGSIKSQLQAGSFFFALLLTSLMCLYIK